MTTSDADSGRQRLIEAAVELFAEQGYEQTSIVDVANRSGVSRGSIPWHFGNKQGLLAAVVDQERDEFIAGFAAGTSHDVEMAVAALTSFTQQPSTGLFITLLAESMRPDSPVRDIHADVHRRIIDAVARWLEEVAPSASSSMRATRASLMLATVIGVQQQWRIAPDRIDVSGTYRLLMSALVVDDRSVPP